MITRTLKSTEGKLTLSIPTTLDELTIGQLMGLQKDTLSDLEAVSVLSYCPLETLYTVRNIEDFVCFKEPAESLMHSMKYLYNSDMIPSHINFKTIGGEVVNKKVDVIKNLSVEPAGAYLNAKNIISEEINNAIKKFGEENWRDNFNPSIKSCCELLAHYFYCRATGKKYDEYEVEKFIDDVKYLPISKALPIAKYFFLKYPNLLKQKLRFWQLVKMYSQKRRVLKSLRNSEKSIQ